MSLFENRQMRPNPASREPRAIDGEGQQDHQLADLARCELVLVVVEEDLIVKEVAAEPRMWTIGQR